MLKIKIEENLYLEGDSRQFMIRRYGKPTIGDDGVEVESYVTLGHYGKLEHVFDALMKMKVLESSAKSLKELLDEVKFYREEIRMLLKGL